VTAIQNKPVDPTAHLSAEDIEAIGRELDAIRARVMDSRGADDAAYIRKVIEVQRTLELTSRVVLLASLFPPAWLAGTVGLSIAKILENMEIGHNVMHGQWDWMRDPKIHSTEWEWDHASPAELWKHSHNELHHTFTNVLGRDNDLGYGIMRVDEDQRWHPIFLAQPLFNLVNASSSSTASPATTSRSARSSRAARTAASSVARAARCWPRSGGRRPATTSSTRCSAARPR
jgi:NADPH-dependent stearoyl-CoA 9-desaturase